MVLLPAGQCVLYRLILSCLLCQQADVEEEEEQVGQTVRNAVGQHERLKDRWFSVSSSSSLPQQEEADEDRVRRDVKHLILNRWK